jgi:hypothetical protein
LATADVAEGGLIDGYIAASTLASSGIAVAADASAAVSSLFAGLTVTQTARLVIWLAIFQHVVNVRQNYVLEGLGGASHPVDVLGKVNVPSKGFAHPEPAPEQTGCTGQEEVNIDSVSSSVTFIHR